MPKTPASLAEVSATVERVLHEQGPLPAAALARALEESGLALDGPAEEVLEDALFSDSAPPAVLVDDDALALLPSLVAGRVFTHRVTAEDLARDALPLVPDLVVIAALATVDGDARLADGTELRVASPFDEPRLARGDEEPGVDDDLEHAALPLGYLAGLGLHPGDPGSSR